MKLHYNKNDGEIVGFYGDGIPYASIPEPCLEIDVEKWQECLDNPGLRKVDLSTLAIVGCELKIPEKTTEEKIAVLDAEYQPRFDSLTLAWSTATMDGNTELAASIKSDKDNLLTEYQAKREEITNG